MVQEQEFGASTVSKYEFLKEIANKPIVGDEYPASSILGVDLSPIQPLWVPPNVRFMVDDVESFWLHKPDSFDYIHARHTSVAMKDMSKLCSEAFR